MTQIEAAREDDLSKTGKKCQAGTPTEEKAAKIIIKTTPESNKNPADTIAAELTDRGFRFYAIIFGLSVTGLISPIEVTVVSTSLPTIVHDLSISNNYAWIVNAYFLTWYCSEPREMELTKEKQHGNLTSNRPGLR